MFGRRSQEQPALPTTTLDLGRAYVVMTRPPVGRVRAVQIGTADLVVELTVAGDPVHAAQTALHLCDVFRAVAYELLDRPGPAPARPVQYR